MVDWLLVTSSSIGFHESSESFLKKNLSLFFFSFSFKIVALISPSRSVFVNSLRITVFGRKCERFILLDIQIRSTERKMESYFMLIVCHFPVSRVDVVGLISFSFLFFSSFIFFSILHLLTFVKYVACVCV